MTSSLNKVTLIGNIGRAPELRYTPNGKAVVTLSLATSSRRKNKASGQWEDEVQWHRVTVLGDQAEWAGEKLTKGRTVYVEGGLRYGSFMKNDQRIPTVEILATHIEPFGVKKPDAPGEGRDDAKTAGPDADQPSANGSGLSAEHQAWVAAYDQ